MFMCVFIEGAFYKYWKLFDRPILVSLVLNTITLVLGFPLGLVAVIDPSWFIIPTILSAIAEGFFGKLFLKQKPIPKYYWLKILFTNLITNIIIVGYILIAVARSRGEWFF